MSPAISLIRAIAVMGSMFRSLQRCLVTVAMPLFAGMPCLAAAVGCARSYIGDPTKPDFSKFSVNPQWEEFARKLWPSGARPKTSSCEVGFLEGTIVKGDYEKVLHLYGSHHPFLRAFFLSSSGGDVGDALKIGRLLRQYLITAEAPQRLSDGRSVFHPEYQVKHRVGDPHATCASACALVWFGAPDRTGTVGLHRPRINDPGFKQLSPTDAVNVYRQALSNIRRYLEEMETPRSVVEAMVATASGEIQWIDDGLISGAARMHRAPSFAEWVAASCGALTIEEERASLELGVKRMQGGRGLSAQEEKLHNKLFDKSVQISRCESALISSSRDKMPAPKVGPSLLFGQPAQ